MTPLDCSKADLLLDAWLDDELDSRQLADLNAHLDGCAPCGQLRDDLLQLRHEAQEINEAGLAAADWSGLRQQLEAQVGPLGQHTATPQAEAGAHLPVSVFTSLSAVLVAAAAAAGIGLAWWLDVPPQPPERTAGSVAALPVESPSSENAHVQGPVTLAKPDRIMPITRRRPAAPEPETVDTTPGMELARTPESAAEPTPDASEPSSAVPAEQAAATTEPPATDNTAAPDTNPADLLERLEALAQLRQGKTSPESPEVPILQPQEPLASISLPVITTDDLPALAALLEDPLPGPIRRRITQVLVDMEGEAVREMLEQVLAAADPAESRATAAWALAARGHTDSRPALQHTAEHDSSAFVRNAARAALEKLDGEGRTRRMNR